jgi:hypothetical protein
MPGLGNATDPPFPFAPFFEEKKLPGTKKVEFRAGLYPLGIESKNTTPHAIHGLVEVKKESFHPSSTTPYVLAYTGSRASNNGRACSGRAVVNLRAQT